MTPHLCCPQTLTPENLGQWIEQNSKHSFEHNEKIPLTDLDIQEFEHKSSAASRALDRLKLVEDNFKHYMKRGTPVEVGIVQPIDITIPPTAGTDVLKANREHADKILEQGYQVEITKLYTIPYPEESTMVVVTIEGQEWPMYTKPMGKDQKAMYGELFAEGGKRGHIGTPLKNKKEVAIEFKRPDESSYQGDGDDSTQADGLFS